MTTLLPTATFADAQLEAASLPEVFLMINTLETGGGERQFAALADGLDRERMNIRLGCLKNDGAFGSGLQEIAEFSPGGSLFGPRAQRARLELGRYLRRHEISVAQAFDFYSNLMLIPAARWAGVPVIIGSHRQLGDLMSWPRFWAQRLVFRLCDRIVCNSRAAADYLRDRGRLDERKLAVIPNGLPDSAFEESIPALPKISGVLRVGMIARMNDPAKNHAAFLRIAAKIANKSPRVEFILIGDGPLRAGLEAEVRSLGLGDRVKLLGERHDVATVLASFDLSVLTSVSESLSNVIMESMAAGVPVVAARVGGNPELIEDGVSGLLVPSGNDDAFAAAIEKLVGDAELRATLATKARGEAKSRFGLRQVCRQYEDLYRTVLWEKGWPAAAKNKITDSKVIKKVEAAVGKD
jgi:L-malate glycosyltransferase